MEVKRTEPNRIGKRFKLRQFLGCVDEGASFGDRRRATSLQPRLIRPAALARAEARCLRVGTAEVKRHIFPFWQPRRTRGPAINPGGTDRVVERVIGCAVAPANRLPTRFIVG
jgi:hypothetical protein